MVVSQARDITCAFVTCIIPRRFSAVSLGYYRKYDAEFEKQKGETCTMLIVFQDACVLNDNEVASVREQSSLDVRWLKVCLY